MMKDNDLKRNASGYYDETCYKGITAPPKAGEIWKHSRSGDYVLILAVNNRVCSILKLTDRECTDCIPVVCKAQMFTSPSMVAYVFNESIGEYVKSLKKEEFSEIQKAVAKALGITATAAVPHDDINAMENEIKMLKSEISDYMAESTKLHFELNAKKLDEKEWNDTYARMSKEITKLNVYKDMYMDLIDKLVDVKVGAVDD